MPAGRVAMRQAREIMRRAWLRGRENVHKRDLFHVAGFNLGVLMRALLGCGTQTKAAGLKCALLFVVQADVATTIVIIAEIDGEMAMLAILAAHRAD